MSHVTAIHGQSRSVLRAHFTRMMETRERKAREYAPAGFPALDRDLFALVREPRRFPLEAVSPART